MNPLFWLWLLPLVFCLLWIDMLVGVFGGKSRVEIFWRWLKGSQKNYILKAYGKVEISEGKNIEWSVPTIEIRRGVFRGQSQICGMGDRVHHWLIARSWRDKRGVDWVQLDEHRGLPASEAVELVRRYPSLQAMLDELERTKTDLDVARGHNEEFRKHVGELDRRISELEEKLRDVDNQRRRFWGVIYAIRVELVVGRSHRSKFSEALRKFLDDEGEKAFSMYPSAPAEDALGYASHLLKREVQKTLRTLA